MTTAKFYDTDQIDARVPNPTGQTQGNVLTIGATGPEWAAPSGSGPTIIDITSWDALVTALLDTKPGDKLLFDTLGKSSTEKLEYGQYTVIYLTNAPTVQEVQLGGTSADYNTSGTTHSYNINRLTLTKIIPTNSTGISCIGATSYGGTISTIMSIDNSTPSPVFINVKIVKY